MTKVPSYLFLMIWLIGSAEIGMADELALKAEALTKTCSVKALGLSIPNSVPAEIERVESVQGQALIAEHRWQAEISKRQTELSKVECLLNALQFEQSKICPNAYAYLISPQKIEEASSANFILNPKGIDPKDYPQLSELRSVRNMILELDGGPDGYLTVEAIDSILEARTGHSLDIKEGCQSSAYVDEKMKTEIRVNLKRAQERLERVIKASLQNGR